MSIYRLNSVFNPKSVAIVGAGPDRASLGGAVLSNLRQGGFAGRIGLVNPRHRDIEGLPCVASLDRLDVAPELIVIATPAATIPAIVESAAAQGVAAAVILSAGLGHGPGSIAYAVRGIARPNGLRIVGPNCLGIMAPAARLNISFAAAMPRAGDLAVISQSGAIAAAMAEWSLRRGMGFSAITSLGDQLDVDLGDLLDYHALDARTRAILLYVESVKDPRKFMSAARAAARTKPVVVLKSGRHAQGAKAAATHTGALAGSDAVYDAAFRRAGFLRVYDMQELFAATETLGHFRSLHGSRLAILTNGGGLGVLAVDRLADFGYAPAELSQETRARLDATMPPTWSKSNPVDIIGDADAARYDDALQALLQDPQNDAVLVLSVETALAPATDTAKAVADIVVRDRSRTIAPKPVLASWIAADETVDAIFRKARIPHYVTGSEAVRGFTHLVKRAETIRSLMAAPPAVSDDTPPDDVAARRAVQTALHDGRTWLDPVETAAVLAAYAIPSTPILRAGNADEACAAARTFLDKGQPVTVKILSRDIPHKSDVDGVRLNLATEQSVREAAETVMNNARRARPSARIDGVMVQPMVSRPGARELICGIARDATFGPVVVFGHGGVAVEVVDDKAIALPPLDLRLADELIGRTRISKLLGSYRNVPAARRDLIAAVLVRLSQLAADLPEVREIDINPLLADDKGVLALDARIAVAPPDREAQHARYAHFAIRPYPKEWERSLSLRDGMDVRVRPVRPEDEPLYERFFQGVTDADMRLRFFGLVKDVGHAFIARLTQIDYGRAMALLAIDEASGEMIGAVRLHADPDYETGEYAILLRSDLKGRGLGWALMEIIIEYARKEGLRRIHGQVLRENVTMLRMCRDLGFDIEIDPGDESVRIVTLDLAKDRPGP